MLYKTTKKTLLLLICISMPLLLFNSCEKKTVVEEPEPNCWGITYPTFDWSHLIISGTAILEVSEHKDFEDDNRTIERVETSIGTYTSDRFYPKDVYYWRIIEKTTGNVLANNILQFHGNPQSLFDGTYQVTSVNKSSYDYIKEGATYELIVGTTPSGFMRVEIVYEENGTSKTVRDYVFYNFSDTESKTENGVLELDITEEYGSGSTAEFFPGTLRFDMNDICTVSLDIDMSGSANDNSYGFKMEKI